MRQVICYYFTSSTGAKYCDQRDCLSVCLFFHELVSQTRCQKSPNFWCMLPVAVARFSSSGIVVICYVFLVLWMTSCLHVLVRHRRRKMLLNMTYESSNMDLKRPQIRFIFSGWIISGSIVGEVWSLPLPCSHSLCGLEHLCSRSLCEVWMQHVSLFMRYLATPGGFIRHKLLR